MDGRGSPGRIGQRVIVSGMAGAGKSTFARHLAAATGLPVIHLDYHFWRPGWVPPPEAEWRALQAGLLAGERWICDGNYLETLALRLARADTVVYLDTPWWVCAARAFVRGLRRPAHTQLPAGCEASAWRQLRDEWWLMWCVWRGRQAERERELALVARYGAHATLHVVRSRAAIRALLERA
jgi:adenylate kinase family enzyme